MVSIEKIQEYFRKDLVNYSHHARVEMLVEEKGRIFEAEVFEAINTGEIIEDYPDDKPYPSTLIFGRAKSKRPIHIVCAEDNIDNLVIIITVYEPDADIWIDFKRRRLT